MTSDDTISGRVPYYALPPPICRPDSLHIHLVPESIGITSSITDWTSYAPKTRLTCPQFSFEHLNGLLTMFLVSHVFRLSTWTSLSSPIRHYSGCTVWFFNLEVEPCKSSHSFYWFKHEIFLRKGMTNLLLLIVVVSSLRK